MSGREERRGVSLLDATIANDRVSSTHHDAPGLRYSRHVPWIIKYIYINNVVTNTSDTIVRCSFHLVGSWSWEYSIETYDMAWFPNIIITIIHFLFSEFSYRFLMFFDVIFSPCYFSCPVLPICAEFIYEPKNES